MDYEQTLNYIHSLNKFGKKAGLSNITRLLDLMGNPQDKTKFVHIAGTNGKGSTTTMIASVLTNAGYKTGKYISPFVLDFRERMQLDNQMISQEDLVSCAAYVKTFADQMTQEGEGPVEFEVVTAIAFEWYARMGCDLVVLEVGLGGRFDSTNVISVPLASVICTIGLDHVEILGNTVEQIAVEKCGIIKDGGVTVCYPSQHPDVLAVIENCVCEKRNRLVMGNVQDAQVLKTGLEGTEITYKDLHLHIPLLGNHQVLNCINAVETLLVLRDTHQFVITNSHIQDGIALVKFPARMEILHCNPTVILDGAHNQSGIDALIDALSMVQDRKITLIIGMLGDKDFSSSLKDLAILADSIYTVTPASPRALDAYALASMLVPNNSHTTACNSAYAAFEKAAKQMNVQDVLVICGSLYLAADMRKIALEYFG